MDAAALTAEERLEQATQVGVRVGGAECSTLVGLARLGLRTAWVSRLTRNAWRSLWPCWTLRPSRPNGSLRSLRSRLTRNA